MKTTHVSHRKCKDELKHKHELEWRNYQKPYTCDGCKEPGFGPRFRCEFCDYDLHKECKVTSPTTHHDFFENSTFEFFDQPPPVKCNRKKCKKCIRYCDACGKSVCGFMYHCEDKDWDLHPCCLNLKSELNTIDGVKWQLHNKVLSECVLCNEKKLRDSNGKSWSYVSECKNYNFHVYCATSLLLEKWKIGTRSNDDHNICWALENLDLSIQRRLTRNRKRRNKYWRIAKVFLQAIASILLGDPSMLIGIGLSQVLFNGG